MRAVPVRVGRIRYVLRLGALMTALGVLLACAGTATAAAPPGRGYEKVSPAGKGGGEVIHTWNVKPSGDAATYAGLAAFDDSPTGGVALISEYSGIRGPSGWSVIDRNPIVIGSAGLFAAMFPGAMTDDYARMIAASLSQYDAGDDDVNKGDFYSVANATTVDWLTQDIPAPGDDTADAAGGALSADGSHFTFQAAPSAGAPQVYERTGGATRLVGIAPDDSPLPGAVLGGGRSQPGLAFIGAFPEPTAMSKDGSRIFFSDASSISGGGTARQLYVRENGTDTTQISLSQDSGSLGDPADQDVDFQVASADGDRVYFITDADLTDGASAGDPTQEGGNLYVYDVSDDELTSVSGTHVLGVVKGADDGSRAYFVSRDALDPDATDGAPNLYVWDNGDVVFIGTLSEADGGLWGGFFTGESMHLAKTTPDGSRVVFNSSADLTPDNDGGFTQVYMYDVAADEITCISCPPGPPTGGGGFTGGSLDAMQNELNFNSVPGDITDDGSTILFQSADPLVTSDSNNRPDGYLWVNGDRQLLGSGTVPSAVTIGGMSNDGQDVFFNTRESLVPIDIDGGEYDVYDARVGGGLPDQQKLPAEPCDGDECRPGAPSPSVFDPPATVDLNGPGNVKGTQAGFAVRAISAAQRRRLARTGRIAVVARVTEAGRVSARALSRLKKRTRTIGNASRRANGPGLVRVRLSLSRAARARLADTGRLRVTLRVSYSEVATASSTRFTLRRAGGR
jgi:hypothetical protein